MVNSVFGESEERGGGEGKAESKAKVYGAAGREKSWQTGGEG